MKILLVLLFNIYFVILPFNNTKINILFYSIFCIYIYIYIIDLITHLFKYQYHIIYLKKLLF